MNIKIQTLVFLVCWGLLLASCGENASQEEAKESTVGPANALESYLAKSDSAFQWQVQDSFSLGQLKVYDILLTSQQWREHVWTHQMSILVPDEIAYNGAMLFVTGGSNKEGQPKWKDKDDETLVAFSQIAAKNKAVVSILRQVPNQPLYDDLNEDALISYTLHHFQEDEDYSWPLLFPMVKSAVKAMDATQEFVEQELQQEISRFLVSGGSKRGWTSWLTGSQDDRVEAIAPMVIDVLNMPVSLDYQVEVWQEYSPQIHDYVDLGIAQQVDSGKGDTLTQMIDPYSYRDKLDMPKLIINGTNDPYWPVDAIKNYLDSIPGENHLLYVPDAGHGLGDKKLSLQSLSAFFGYVLNKSDYPELQWEVSEESGNIHFSTSSSSGNLLDIKLWTASSTDRDFRDEKWQSTSLKSEDGKQIEVIENYPDSGFKAFYIDLIFEDPNGGEFTESTRMFVADDDEVFLR